MFKKMNDYLIKYFASVPIEDLDFTITLEDGRVRIWIYKVTLLNPKVQEKNLKDLGTVEYRLPFYASVDLSEDPSMIPAVRKAAAQANILTQQLDTAVHFELPLQIKAESEMAEAKRILFEEFEEEWKNVGFVWSFTELFGND